MGKYITDSIFFSVTLISVIFTLIRSFADPDFVLKTFIPIVTRWYGLSIIFLILFYTAYILRKDNLTAENISFLNKWILVNLFAIALILSIVMYPIYFGGVFKVLLLTLAITINIALPLILLLYVLIFFHFDKFSSILSSIRIKKKTLLLILIFTIVLFSLICTILFSDEGFPRYEFYIRGSPEEAIMSTSISFYVDEDKGNIILSLDESIKYLHLSLPSKVLVSESFLDSHTYTMEGNNNDTYEFTNLDEGKLIIPIEGKISPNGRFSATSRAWRFDAIYFFTSKYDCEAGCFTSIQNAGIRPRDDYFLVTSKPDGRESDEYLFFDLNTTNRLTSNLRNLFLAFLISIMAGYVLLVLNWLSGSHSK